METKAKAKQGKSILINHVYPLIDIMIDDAEETLKQEDIAISCKRGCNHCCHLLIEVNWEEATVIAEWILEQSPDKRDEFIQKVKDNAQKARDIFAKYKKSRPFMEPVKRDIKIPDAAFDDYFEEEKHPCMFLDGQGACGIYSIRPSPCRLHLVTSPPENCSAEEVFQEDDVDVPEEIEAVRDDISPVITNICKDERWGHFGIMVEAVLNNIQNSHE